ncbi:hypothetical protein Pyn_16976 [Prunus yedoensis var. nudiflora]|uniref:Uncharacterized protein n=1 Tax=Prunus yedoensis var. nudiflora TaxID=2094558 RepID=A0A314ZIA9_PRUYE|nr:hypothetical protein Pyn_11926 [Prunus yedoensis var. nudiflora]PQQ19059.1 hypothetical protein Pyn_16976 [Prunus yedoensis var. nudiflora]
MRFIHKVAASGLPRAKGNVPSEPSLHRELVASGGSKHVGETSEALPSHSTPRSKSRDNKAPMIAKSRSMHILQARFVDTHRGKDESFGAKVVVTVDDGVNDEGDVAGTKIATHE